MTPDPHLRIRPMLAQDLPLVRGWMQNTPRAPSWSADDFAQVIRMPQGHAGRSRRGWIAEHEELGSTGFVVAATLFVPGSPAECELEYVLVLPEARHRGIGGMLVGAVAGWARELKAEEIRLEVRESNAAALRLYERCGFAPAGRRPEYYSDPPEDALLMRSRITD